jgi:hypothetical protein
MTGRNARFVAAARRLLIMQVGACLLAVAVAGWAWFEVRDLVRERDALAAKIVELERRAQSLPPRAPTAVIAPVPAPAPRRAAAAAPRTKEGPRAIGKSVETPTPVEPAGGEASPTDPKPTEPAGEPPRETNRPEEAPLTRR